MNPDAVIGTLVGLLLLSMVIHWINSSIKEELREDVREWRGRAHEAEGEIIDLREALFDAGVDISEAPRPSKWLVTLPRHNR